MNQDFSKNFVKSEWVETKKFLPQNNSTLKCTTSRNTFQSPNEMNLRQKKTNRNYFSDNS